MAKKSENLDRIGLTRNTTEFIKQKITSSTDSAAYIRQFYNDDISIYESMFILLLNRANKTIGYAKISQGGVTDTVVDVKIIMKYAVDTLANSVILAHNHPSGNLQESNQDLAVTKKVKEALQMMDVSLLDHIILTDDGYKSMADDGLI